MSFFRLLMILTAGLLHACVEKQADGTNEREAVRQWVYTSGTDVTEQGVLVILSSPKILTNHHTISKWESCSNTDLTCIIGGGIQFAVPNDLGNQQIWSSDGIRWKVKRSGSTRLLGRDFPLTHVIEAKESDLFHSYLYSESAGLIGMSFSNREDLYYQWMIEGSCGFAAPPTCKETISELSHPSIEYMLEHRNEN